jgi:glycine/D-amino acid oxidase-like deaminating enzyme
MPGILDVMDLPIRSPWLHQLDRKRPVTPLARDIDTDVAIIGGGIAGITTAYFLLRDTPNRVVLLEADRVAHGATGHNAGQLVAEFERSFGSIVNEFGLEMTKAGYRAVDSAWDLLEGIIRDEQLTVPLWRLTGYGALSDRAQIMDYLADLALRIKAGITRGCLLIAAERKTDLNIPAEYEALSEWIPHGDLLKLCEAKDDRYIALWADTERGCMNSALFCDQLAQAMLKRWPDRFAMHEQTPARMITLHQGTAEIATASKCRVSARRIVLCTNGFEGFRIVDDKKIDVDTKFHRNVSGTIGYMAAFLEPHDRPPMANWYQDRPGNDPTEPYFYMTRRPYDMGPNGQHNLLGVGGPEVHLPEEVAYDRSHPFDESVHTEIDTWMRRTYAHYGPARTEDAFFWHGLMGYTPNGLRIIGSEPCNHVLLYNIGCNGIGLLHSIYGGYKIARITLGIPQEPSIFDPRDATCPVPGPTGT